MNTSKNEEAPLKRIMGSPDIEYPLSKFIFDKTTVLHIVTGHVPDTNASGLWRRVRMIEKNNPVIVDAWTHATHLVQNLEHRLATQDDIIAGALKTKERYGEELRNARLAVDRFLTLLPEGAPE